MSYSFTVTGKNKEEAKVNAHRAIMVCIEQQSAHAADRNAILDDVARRIDCVQEQEGYEILVTGYGSAQATDYDPQTGEYKRLMSTESMLRVVLQKVQ